MFRKEEPKPRFTTEQYSVTEDMDLREQLTDEQYSVTQESGTERPFTGEHLEEKRAGMFRCVVCDEPLFDSETKYDSDSGWPSFTAPAEGSNVEEHADTKFGMTRTENRCGNCGAHLGHVFPDGPGSDGMRYCINSAALNFEPSEDTEA
jgi:peptide-methionine (R)-S-oxide reductase